MSTRHDNINVQFWIDLYTRRAELHQRFDQEEQAIRDLLTTPHVDFAGKSYSLNEIKLMRDHAAEPEKTFLDEAVVRASHVISEIAVGAIERHGYTKRAEARTLSTISFEEWSVAQELGTDRDAELLPIIGPRHSDIARYWDQTKGKIAIFDCLRHCNGASTAPWFVLNNEYMASAISAVQISQLILQDDRHRLADTFDLSMIFCEIGEPPPGIPVPEILAGDKTHDWFNAAYGISAEARRLNSAVGTEQSGSQLGRTLGYS